MGRALFSQNYHSSPAVRTEPEPSVAPYEKWTHWNFDPDSEEFFVDAVIEDFVDPAQYRQEEEEEQGQAIVFEGDGNSPVSSESSVSDRDSPMAVGSDDPATMIGDAYSTGPIDWEEGFLLAEPASPEWRRIGDTGQSAETQGYTPLFNPLPPRPIAADSAGEPTRFSRGNRPRAATVSVVLTPSSLRNSTTAADSNTPSPISLRRTVNITPINIPVHPSSLSPTSPPSPTTPPSQVTYSRQFQILSDTPSTQSSDTPRRWTRHPTPISYGAASPSQSQASGPLTNPSARMSLARIAPARVRVQNAVI